MAIAGVVIGAVQLVWLFVTGALLLAALPIFAILGSVGAFGWN
jgi:hypothetical protein